MYITYETAMTYMIHHVIDAYDANNAHDLDIDPLLWEGSQMAMYASCWTYILLVCIWRHSVFFTRISHMTNIMQMTQMTLMTQLTQIYVLNQAKMQNHVSTNMVISIETGTNQLLQNTKYKAVACRLWIRSANKHKQPSYITVRILVHLCIER